jgi:pimeloyl-ACP methyl ester carboxylesterase
MSSFGADVQAVVEKLDLKPVVLVGHSMGGPVIVEAARRMPERVAALVPVDALRDVDEFFTPEQVEHYLTLLRTDFVENTKKFVRENMFTPKSDPALVNKIADDMASAPPEIGIGALEGIFHFDPRPALREIKAPIRCVNSDKYPSKPEAGKRYNARFEVVVMTGVGHFVMMEDPETFNQLLQDALQSLVPAAQSGPQRTK